MNLVDTIIDPGLQEIAVKVERNVPVDRADALYILGCSDIIGLGTIAGYMRSRLHGNRTYYSINMNLNYTNICELRCPLCAYSRDEGDPGSFLLSLDEIEQKVREASRQGVEEVHIVGGLNPGLKMDYFEGMICRIKQIDPGIFVVAFTAVEYDYFARLNGIPVEEVFQRLIRAGVNALPGGGAEIFSPGVREVIAPKKIPGKRWLEIMGIAHQMGLKTNATLLYNHIESDEDIVDHLFKIRELQDRTGGFKTLVPLSFHEENTRVKAARSAPTGYDDIRIYAASRIVLHNVPHIKVLWMYVGEKMAQVLLRFGADDLGGTYVNEKVVHAAGAKTPSFGSEPSLCKLIREAGLEPVRSNAGYAVESNV